MTAKATGSDHALQLGVASPSSDPGEAVPAVNRLLLIPAAAAPYKRTPEFTESSVPGGLLKAHCTKGGVWATIHVIEGELLYRVTDPRHPLQETVLTPDGPPGLVEPTILHEVEPRGTVRFYVEFHR
jgi:tellurite resistance-related uncharacterized protein